MAKFKLSKNVKPGHLVSWRGDKLIKASRRSRIAGVFNEPDYILMTDMDGNDHEFHIPAGLRRRGTASVLTKGMR